MTKTTDPAIRPPCAWLGLSSALAMSFALLPSAAQAAPDEATTSITRPASDAKTAAAREPTYATREERLKAKPLDWKTTVGKPAKVAQPSAAEIKAQRAAPASAEGGAPHPQADEEARKLYPEDWKK